MAKNRHLQEEPRDNDGKVWKKEELIKACQLYLTEKSKIHEHNLEIQELALSLKRNTRAVEAQMLMFRNLDQGGEYSMGQHEHIMYRGLE